MSIQVESMPIFCLIWIVIGVAIMVVAFIRLAGHRETEDYYVKMSRQSEGGYKELEELFNYFLEEEEKKNQDFRTLMMDVTQKKNKEMEKDYLPEGYLVNHDNGTKAGADAKPNASLTNQGLYDEIVSRLEKGEEIEKIAKTLKKGVGEVKLILSLYNMR